MRLETPLPFFAILLGAIVGSFLNVVIHRLPQEERSIVSGPSHCPNCFEHLCWHEKIPIFSYLFLKGKCRHCNTSISPQYPLVELAMATFSGALFLKFGLTALFAGYFLLAAALLVVMFIDFYHYIIPDSIDLPGIVAGLLFSFINPSVSWQSSLIGIIAGGGVFWTVAAVYSFFRNKEGMGGGDIKLLAMIGAWFGWQSLPFVILFSSITGSIVGVIGLYLRKKNQSSAIPFGPFLSAAALLYLFFPKTIGYYFERYISGQWP